MTNLDTFAHALRRSDRPLPTGLRVWNGSDPRARFDVYKNNVAVSLVDALCVTHPVCLQLVGEEYFRAMARLYVEAHKPSSRIMYEYGYAFCDFITVFPPAEDIPYLGDVARLEAARVRAFHAADAAPLGELDFAALDLTRLADVRIALHPTAFIIRSPFAIYSFWAAHHDAMEIDSFDPFTSEDALVTRPAFDVETRRLPPGASDFLQHISRGETIGEAVLRTHNDILEFDLAQTLRIIIESGAAGAFIEVRE